MQYANRRVQYADSWLNGRAAERFAARTERRLARSLAAVAMAFASVALVVATAALERRRRR